MVSSAIAIALLFTPAATTAPAAKPMQTASEKPQEKLVCRKEAPVGSLIAKKKCRTQREWSALSEATRRELQQGTNSGGTNGN